MNKDLVLREYVAIERTRLANETTLLANLTCNFCRMIEVIIPRDVCHVYNLSMNLALTTI